MFTYMIVYCTVHVQHNFHLFCFPFIPISFLEISIQNKYYFWKIINNNNNGYSNYTVEDILLNENNHLRYDRVYAILYLNNMDHCETFLFYYTCRYLCIMYILHVSTFWELTFFLFICMTT